MTFELLGLLLLAVGVVAFLYSAVGHAGASGYIAVMSLFGLAPADIKPTALALNILVAGISTWQFWRRGYFSWALFWPFAVLAIPLAFLGGYLHLPAHLFRVVVGLILLFTAARFLLRPAPDTALGPPSRPVALAVGGGLGLLSGLTGTGGGIFLTPLFLHQRWAPAKETAAVAALFILVNSIAGLLGNLGGAHAAGGPLFPSYAPWLALVAMGGGAAGSYFGSQRFGHAVITRLIAAVLGIAGAKLLLT